MSGMLKITLEQQRIAEEFDARLKAIGGAEIRWSLFVWHPAEGKTNYLSTADRPEVMKILGDMVDRWRQGAEQHVLGKKGR